ncbi:MAG: cold-shock protein [Parachlamydiales bacterium]|nr:cold-shock protein [Parachlamydiales bacterium]
MPRGTIRWYSVEKGFGFIIPDEGGKDLYVQSSNIDTSEHELSDFQRVEYQSTLGRQGPEAIHVCPL